MKKLVKEMQKRWKAEEEKYSFKNYKPNKNCISCTVNGVTYLSKKQACVLEGITRKELDAYLNSQTKTVVKPETPKQIAIEENLGEQTEELVQDILAEQNETSLDSLLNN